MHTDFTGMGLAAPLLQALQALDINSPTEVQSEAIPKALQGGDWMVSSRTGSGKTFAFLLPVLNRMMTVDESPMKALMGPTALVLCPTRELAQQVMADAIELLKKQRGIRVASVVGGAHFVRQINSLRGAQLVVATPGRLLDLVNQRKLSLESITTLVLDEADRMLDLGFQDDLEAIDNLCRGRSQTLMFSATFAGRVMDLACGMMKEPGRIELAKASDTNTDIAQSLYWANNYDHKRKLLDHFLRDASMEQSIVFASTQIESEKLARSLEDDGFSAAALHGGMPQNLRNRRLKQLRDGHLKILIATDVAARGIDVPTISHVLNFGLPMKPEDYVHRIGRTGRAGRSGIAMTLAEYADRRRVNDIQRYIKKDIPEAIVEGLEPSPPAKGSFGKGKGQGQGRGGRTGGGGYRSADNGGSRFSGDRERSGPKFGGDRERSAPRFGGDRDRSAPRFSGERSAPRFADRSEPFSFPSDRPRVQRDVIEHDIAPRFDRRGERVFDRAPAGEGKRFGGGASDRRDSRPSFGDSRPSFGDRPKSNGFGGDRPKRFDNGNGFEQRSGGFDRGNGQDRGQGGERRPFGDRSSTERTASFERGARPPRPASAARTPSGTGRTFEKRSSSGFERREGRPNAEVSSFRRRG